ncbi:MAG: acetyltransferase [Xanthobacteraceae bacterium]|nr:acetyltransferase [Xanthobacteraceae bacterium]
MSRGAKIHPSADVSPDAKLGDGVRVWQNCVVMAGAEIGDGSQLSANVFVEGKVRLGRNVKVKNNVSLYDGVVLQDDVFVGPSAVFTNVLTPRSRWPRKHDFRDTVVQQGATIGANAVVVCGVTIGPSALIGAGSVVTRDVAAFTVVTGNPARQTNFVCLCGVLLPEARLASAGDALSCTACGSSYRRGAKELVPQKLADPPA